MANTNMKWVHRDGVNAPTDLINGYQVCDNVNEQATGIAGDFLHDKTTGNLYLHRGNRHVIIYHTEYPPPVPPPAPLNMVYIDGNSNPVYNLSDYDDILICAPNPVNITVNLHKCATAKPKVYYIKVHWYAPATVTVRVGTAGDVIDVQYTSVTISYPTTLALFPFPGNIYWNIL